MGKSGRSTAKKKEKSGDIFFSSSCKGDMKAKMCSAPQTYTVSLKTQLFINSEFNAVVRTEETRATESQNNHLFKQQTK